MANVPDYFAATMNKNLAVDIDETLRTASAVDSYATEKVLFLVVVFPNFPRIYSHSN